MLSELGAKLGANGLHVGDVLKLIPSIITSPYFIVAVPVLYFVLPWLSRPSLWNIPGPTAGALTNFWLLYQCRRGRRYLAVDDAHKKYGKMVRIQPNHVSVADVDAIQIIYGHGNGFLKSEYYDAFVSIVRGLFNTRDRAEHARKRKIVSHTFSAKSIGQFEQYMHENLELFFKRWTQFSDNAKGTYTDMDALNWFNYLAFDIIGDLAFGSPFGMLERGKDIAEVKKSPNSEPTYARAIEVLNRRGEVSGTLGCLPQLKPYAKHLPDPFFSNGLAAIENLAGIAIARVQERLSNPDETGRVDLLARLIEGRDANGETMGREELTAEAQTQLIAGSDTTSNTSCAILYHVLSNPYIIPKLQKELDERLDSFGVPEYKQVKDLPYLDMVIKETLRIHSTSSLGLPRIVTYPEGVTILNHHFPTGTVLSVPAYTIHHSKEVWGPDASQFRPERWEKDQLTETQKAAFIPFSYGPRACVGRNVAEMELTLITATVFKNFEFELKQNVFETREGFLRKPLGLKVGMRRRG